MSGDATTSRSAAPQPVATPMAALSASKWGTTPNAVATVSDSPMRPSPGLGLPEQRPGPDSATDASMSATPRRPTSLTEDDDATNQTMEAGDGVLPAAGSVPTMMLSPDELLEAAAAEADPGAVLRQGSDLDDDTPLAEAVQKVDGLMASLKTEISELDVLAAVMEHRQSQRVQAVAYAKHAGEQAQRELAGIPGFASHPSLRPPGQASRWEVGGGVGSADSMPGFHTGLTPEMEEQQALQTEADLLFDPHWTGGPQRIRQLFGRVPAAQATTTPQLVISQPSGDDRLIESEVEGAMAAIERHQLEQLRQQIHDTSVSMVDPNADNESKDCHDQMNPSKVHLQHATSGDSSARGGGGGPVFGGGPASVDQTETTTHGHERVAHSVVAGIVLSEAVSGGLSDAAGALFGAPSETGTLRSALADDQALPLADDTEAKEDDTEAKEDDTEAKEDDTDRKEQEEQTTTAVGPQSATDDDEAHAAVGPQSATDDDQEDNAIPNATDDTARHPHHPIQYRVTPTSSAETHMPMPPPRTAGPGSARPLRAAANGNSGHLDATPSDERWPRVSTTNTPRSAAPNITPSAAQRFAANSDSFVSPKHGGAAVVDALREAVIRPMAANAASRHFASSTASTEHHPFAKDEAAASASSPMHGATPRERYASLTSPLSMARSRLAELSTVSGRKRFGWAPVSDAEQRIASQTAAAAGIVQPLEPATQQHSSLSPAEDTSGSVPTPHEFTSETASRPTAHAGRRSRSASRTRRATGRSGSFRPSSLAAVASARARGARDTSRHGDAAHTNTNTNSRRQRTAGKKQNSASHAGGAESDGHSGSSGGESRLGDLPSGTVLRHIPGADGEGDASLTADERRLRNEARLATRAAIQAAKDQAKEMQAHLEAEAESRQARLNAVKTDPLHSQPDTEEAMTSRVAAELSETAHRTRHHASFMDVGLDGSVVEPKSVKGSRNRNKTVSPGKASHDATDTPADPTTAATTATSSGDGGASDGGPLRQSMLQRVDRPDQPNSPLPHGVPPPLPELVAPQPRPEQPPPAAEAVANAVASSGDGVPSSPAPLTPRIVGMLFKADKSAQKWKRRHAVLIGTNIFYFTSAAHRERAMLDGNFSAYKPGLDISMCSLQPLDEPLPHDADELQPGAVPIALQRHRSQRVFYWAAIDATEAAEWAIAICEITGQATSYVLPAAV